MNKIIGGESNDTLWDGEDNDYLYGGEGADIFVYNSGEGTDKIFDYDSAVDKIMILSGDKPILSDNPLSNDATFMVGNGKIVVENGAGKNISFIGSNGKPL